MARKSKKRSIAVTGSWLPVPLDFLRSRAAAELSPHAAKLLLDVLALLGPNAAGNGDISLAPRTMRTRGWTSKSSLHAAIAELTGNGLLSMTRQGSRLDCSLYACTLFPLDCDLSKLDVRPGSYLRTDYMGEGRTLANPPTETHPAAWRHARKSKTVPPPRDDLASKRPATGRTTLENSSK